MRVVVQREEVVGVRVGERAQDDPFGFQEDVHAAIITAGSGARHRIFAAGRRAASSPKAPTSVRRSQGSGS
ncbi:hypothetical protein GCM10010272_26500 [Streptomyces lateritius]|nr:hypothetical protein GCM10010272_26500 [Streptomyces lateritius]